ncbi:histidine phosphotransferase family protein [Roseospirillum parvum]|uniref:Histidine phosphotransferase ChpT n=1 Tax=Roseospirillum parvum TaxID=83401 RepID=A0A1G8CML2_9PROT|nr:histidine phosphotransferase family protein [Roseospirillum parvum]SDH46646.1 histidine phosphotransferase ChpT [Roseospirillum parvum]
MPDDPELALAQLLATRLCHDLAGPLGAVGAGVELLAEEGGAPDAATLSLIVDSQRAMSARLRFLRAALGWTASGAPLTGPAGRDLLAALLAHQVPAVELAWGIDPTAPSGGLRLALNVALVGLDTLPGCRALALAGDAQGRLEVSLGGGAGAPRDSLLEVLRGLAPGDGPRTAHAAYTRRLALVDGWTLTASPTAAGAPGLVLALTRPG